MKNLIYVAMFLTALPLAAETPEQMTAQVAGHFGEGKNSAISNIRPVKVADAEAEEENSDIHDEENWGKENRIYIMRERCARGAREQGDLIGTLLGFGAGWIAGLFIAAIGETAACIIIGILVMPLLIGPLLGHFIGTYVAKKKALRRFDKSGHCPAWTYHWEH